MSLVRPSSQNNVEKKFQSNNEGVGKIRQKFFRNYFVLFQQAKLFVKCQESTFNWQQAV